MQNLHRYITGFASLFLIIQLVVAQQWVYRTPMPTARKGMAVAVLQDKIWVMGGKKKMHHATNVVEVYDPVNNSWSIQYPHLNYARESAAAEVYDGKIFVFGGVKEGQFVTAVEMFDPNAGIWQTVSYLPTPRMGMASVVKDSGIWLIGGGGHFSNYINFVEIFYPSTLTWDTLSATLNIPRADPMATVVNGEVMVFGGYFYGPVSSYEKYNSTTQSWEIVGNIPYYCASSGYTGANGWAWIIGGAGQVGVLDKVQVLRPLNGLWQWWQGPPLNTPRRSLVAATVQDKVFAIGGQGQMGGQISDTVEMLDVLTAIQSGDIPSPEKYALLRNYPNPFNTSTLIEFDLPEADEVNLKLYDITGKTVYTLFKGRLPAGEHQIRFSATDGIDRELPSGIYIIRLTGSKFTVTHKMYLVK